MINYTDINNDDLAASNPFGVRLKEAEVDGWREEGNPNRMWGYTDLVAFWEGSGRAGHVSNGDPVWYDASSLEAAMEMAQSGEYEEYE